MGRPLDLVPGLVALLAVGLAARAVASSVPAVHYLVVALGLGLLVGHTVGVPEWVRPGSGTHSLWLEAGIVLMGASVALERVVAAGPSLLVLVGLSVTTTILVVEALARVVFSIREETGSLLAAGSGICGVSAVVAVAESISVDEGDVAYAAATVLLFDAVTLVAYPLVGSALGLSDVVFGVWAGLTMFSTGPVVAAGFAYSDAAGQWALLVKLARNSTIGVAAVGYALYYARADGGGSASGLSGRARSVWRTFPKFVLGFLAMVVVANVGVLDASQVESLSNASEWAFLLAFAGLGFELRLGDLRATGVRPILVVLTGLLVVATTTLLVVGALF